MRTAQVRVWLIATLLASLSVASGQEPIVYQDGDACAEYAAEDCSCCKAALLGFIQPTDPAWAGFISPMTNPVFFEDPRTLTEARFIFIDHQVPSLAGGAIPSSRLQVLAVQLRAALTHDLSLIATKDGFIFPSAGAPLDDGWADVSLGLKYNLWKDCCCQRILSVGATYELPVGSTQALQGNGDGEFNLFASYGALFGDSNHFLTTLGLRLPTDRSEENQVFYWSAHVDRQFCGTCWYGFLEGTWYHWLSNGDNAAFNGIQGGDLFNFGSTGVAGTDIVTGAVGLKYKPSLLNEIGVAYEVPLTDERGVLQHRFTADYILRY
ncbi:hypothetical protein ETAA8_65110 [Anatilimnocola aggregata]|uniref:Transporter n=1 Tax=Anatilimnocola aggregata TaxID=2528021 RepID=A0A517YMA6_9BACT|nr:hypothetical protein [Anatilimnocola aggregata]QDU31355.1 hypothetical protein ETAA8_65110 [Anatilimnocola aggregata]